MSPAIHKLLNDDMKVNNKVIVSLVSLQVFTTPEVKQMPSGWTVATVSLQVYTTPAVKLMP